IPVNTRTTSRLTVRKQTCVISFKSLIKQRFAHFSVNNLLTGIVEQFMIGRVETDIEIKAILLVWNDNSVIFDQDVLDGFTLHSFLTLGQGSHTNSDFDRRRGLHV